jgi:hypothetical protein
MLSGGLLAFRSISVAHRHVIARHEPQCGSSPLPGVPQTLHSRTIELTVPFYLHILMLVRSTARHVIDGLASAVNYSESDVKIFLIC